MWLCLTLFYALASLDLATYILQGITTFLFVCSYFLHVLHLDVIRNFPLPKCGYNAEPPIAIPICCGNTFHPACNILFHQLWMNI